MQDNQQDQVRQASAEGRCRNPGVRRPFRRFMWALAHRSNRPGVKSKKGRPEEKRSSGKGSSRSSLGANHGRRSNGVAGNCEHLK